MILGNIEHDISIDKIKLSCMANTYSVYKTFMNEIKINNYLSNYWSSSIQDYMYNFNLKYNYKFLDNKQLESSIYFGFFHNSKHGGNIKSCENKKINLVCEFNPSKIKHSVQSLDFFKKIYNFYFRKNNFTVNFCDIALDLYDVNISNLVFDKAGKREKRIFDMSGSNRTVYIGKKSSRSCYKIYNKKQELDLSCDFIEDWTRFEVSLRLYEKINLLKDIDNINISGSLPRIYLFDDRLFNSLSLSKTDKCLIKALLKGVIILKELSRRKRDKIKPYINEFKLQLSKKPFKEILSNFLINIDDFILSI